MLFAKIFLFAKLLARILLAIKLEHNSVSMAVLLDNAQNDETQRIFCVC